MVTFTSGELEIMQVLWGQGTPMKPSDIERLFPRPIKNAALRSALLVLLEKGHITRTKVGKAYYYQAKVPKETVIERMARRMSEIFCGGSPAALIAHLIQTGKLSEEDILYIKEVASSQSSTGNHKKKKGESS